MNTIPLQSSFIILPEDDEATIAAKKNNLVQALAAGGTKQQGDILEGLRNAYEIARASGVKAEEERLIRAINRTFEMRRLLRRSGD